MASRDHHGVWNEYIYIYGYTSCLYTWVLSLGFGAQICPDHVLFTQSFFVSQRVLIVESLVLVRGDLFAHPFGHGVW